MEEKKIFTLSAAAAVLGYGMMAASDKIVWYFLGMTVLSLGNSFLSPIIQSIVSEKSSEHEQGGNMGLLQSYGSAGRIFGPIVGGLIYEKINPFSPGIMAAVIFVFIFIIGLRLTVSD